MSYVKWLSAADVVLTQFKKRKEPFFVLLENNCIQMNTFLMVPLAFECFV